MFCSKSELPVGFSVWSDNNTTSPGSSNNGWTANAITPTLSGLPAKYIYFFVDEALRSCNINEECESLIKWFGFIQRDQFGNADDNSITAKYDNGILTLNIPKITPDDTKPATQRIEIL